MDTAPTYLVVIDQSAESRVALRFAALRAGHVGARVALLHVIRPPEFMQWGAVQEAMAAEARAEAAALLETVADAAEALAGTRRSFSIMSAAIRRFARWCSVRRPGARRGRSSAFSPASAPGNCRASS